jgi:hypothetical protein
MNDTGKFNERKELVSRIARTENLNSDESLDSKISDNLRESSVNK